jgi:hypothetical protein
MVNFLASHRVGDYMSGLDQLVRQALAQGTGNQACDHVGTRGNHDEGEEKIRKNNLEANAHGVPEENDISYYKEKAGKKQIFVLFLQCVGFKQKLVKLCAEVKLSALNQNLCAKNP